MTPERLERLKEIIEENRSAPIKNHGLAGMLEMFSNHQSPQRGKRIYAERLLTLHHKQIRAVEQATYNAGFCVKRFSAGEDAHWPFSKYITPAERNRIAKLAFLRHWARPTDKFQHSVEFVRQYALRPYTRIATAKQAA